jgi:hypothetical protein
MGREQQGNADLIQQYLTRLRASLPAREADQILAEAEDHLRETVRAALAAGLTEGEAQDAAISAFGSVTAVVRAHRARHFRSGALAGDLATAALKLSSLILLAVGLSGVLDLMLEFTVGGNFVAGVATSLTPAQCAQVRLEYPYAARNCAQASVLGGGSGHLTACLLAGLSGLLLLECYAGLRRLQRHRDRSASQVLPAGFFPAAAVSVFGLLAAGLLCRTGVIAADGDGPGGLLMGAVVAMAVTVFYARRLRGRRCGTVWMHADRARLRVNR